MSRVRLHHGPLGQLQETPEEARPGHRRLGESADDGQQRRAGSEERDGSWASNSQKGSRGRYAVHAKGGESDNTLMLQT